MKRFIGITFLLLGWSYYEMSGGADFVPETRGGAVQAATSTPSDSDVVAARDIERGPSGIPVTAMREFPENVELIAANYMPKPVASATSASAATAPAQETAEAEAQPIDLRQIAGDWVNMRAGPGTAHSVLDTLPRGTEARVLENTGGWSRIELIESGEIGWMSDRLLAPVQG